MEKHHNKNGRNFRLKPKAINVSGRMQEGAVIISGALNLITRVEDCGSTVAAGLEEAAKKITAAGGIVGHIKCSASVLRQEMISVLEEEAMIKLLPKRRVKITLAAIVFLIEQSEAEKILRAALEDILKILS